LWESQPVFQAVLKQCDEILKPQMEFGLLDLIFNQATPDAQLHQTIHTQPVIFAIGYALAKMWESWGVIPSVVLGHSIGEVAAACFAGVIGLEDALGLVALRGRLIHRSTTPGMMGAIVASPDSVAAAIKELGGQVTIAAINAPENVVISGQTAAVQRILEHFKSRDIPSLALRISHAIHSPLMDPILDEYTAAVERISLSRPAIPLISNLTGRVAGDEITRPDYWRRQLRQTVNFRACLETLRESGCQIALETGATSILSSMGLQCLPGSDMLWLHSLGPKNSLFNMRPQRIAGRNDWETLLDTLGQLYARGANLNWRQIESGFPWRRVRLPNYPFQRKTYRMETMR
jgi:acyl transferase domain-containing protein